MARLTRWELYQEALTFLRESADAIDQAHAVLKDLKLDDIEIRTAHGPMGVLTLSILVEDMVRAALAADCSACDHALGLHGYKHACAYGDPGTCGCTWGMALARKGEVA